MGRGVEKRIRNLAPDASKVKKFTVDPDPAVI